MEQRVIDELNAEVPTKFQVKMLEHCRALVKLSRGRMSDYYARWDQYSDAYEARARSSITSKTNDKNAEVKGQPTNIGVPLTYSQIQTFVAFGMGILQQRDRFFELEGTGEEDHKSAKLGEALLEHNLQYSNMPQKTYQLLLDMGRFSIGVIKHSWETEMETVWVQQEKPSMLSSGPLSFLGKLLPTAEPEMEDVRVEQIRYQGNKLYSISPYRFFPDPRLPLTRYQEGEFCASEDEFSMTSLRKGEQSGLYAGVDFIKKFDKGDFEQRGQSRFTHVNVSENLTGRQTEQSEGVAVVTEVQVELVPSQFILSDGNPLGDSDTPEKWIVVYANDNRLIRIEPSGYAHNNFTYHVAQFSQDQHNFINESISQMLGQLQDVIDWFLNSHITNVRKHITNRMVVDPAGIHYEDLKNHKAVIRLKPAASKQGVDRYIKQLNVSDVTRGHISDIAELMKFAQMTTAISDNLMGQFHSGRRSAREASNVSAASGARLRNIIKLVFSTTFDPMGRDLLSNLRDGLEEDTFVTVSGDEFPDWEVYNGFKINNDRIKVPVNRTTLNGKFDFKIFEGTLPSEKGAQADTLQEILENILKNPQGMQIILQLGYDPAKLFKEVLELRGIKHPDRFKVDAYRAAEYQQQMQALNGPPTTPEQSGPGLQSSEQQPPLAIPAGDGGFSSLISGS